MVNKMLKIALLGLLTIAGTAQGVIHVEDKLKPGLVGQFLADAIDIETAAGSDVQTVLNSQGTSIAQTARAGIAWNYDTDITDDPPLNTFRFNNADPTLATTIYLDRFSIAGRFDEFLTQFATGGFIYLQDRTSPANNFLFKTTAAITGSGGNSGWFVVPVEFLRTQSTFTAAGNDTFTFIFIPITGTNGGSADLPNMFLNEISEQDTPEYTRKIDTEAVVRFWLREDLVTPGNVNTADVGLRIDEANGDLPEGGDTYQIGSNDSNVYIYLTLDSVFDTATDLNTVWLRITRDQGQPDERVIDTVNVGAHFTERTDLTALVTGVAYESATGFDGNGPLIHYLANDVIELYFQDTNQFFTISETNAPNVDLTRAVKDLPESATDSDVQAKLNRVPGISDIDQSKLDVFVEQTSASTPGALTGTDNMYYKRGSFSNDVNEYFVTTFDGGLPPNFGDGTTTWLVAAPHTSEITSFANDVATGTATKILTDVKITGATAKAYDVYTVVLNSSGVSTVPFGALGATITVTEIDPTDIFKIGTNNFNDALKADFARLHANDLSEAMQDLESHLTVTHVADTPWTVPSNPTSVRSTITRLWAAEFQDNREGTSPFLGNWFDDLPNPTLSGTPVWSENADDTRFPGKQSFFLGTVNADGVSTFGNGSNKLVSFTFYVSDADFNDEVPLLKFGTRRILQLRRDGIYATVGNNDGSPTTATFDRRLQQSGASNTIQYLEGTAATFTDWAVPSTPTFPLSITFRLRDVDIATGTTGTTTTVNYVITDRDVTQAQSSQVVAVNEAVGGGTRNETFLTSYDGTTHVLTFGTNQLALNTGNSVTRIGLEATFNDSEEIQTSTTTTDVALDTQVNVIQNEVVVTLILEPQVPDETTADKRLRIVAVVNGNQENDVDLNLREAQYTFSDLQFGPNSGTAVALSQMQVYSYDNGGIPFNTPTHSELYQMQLRQAQYLGLFRAPNRNYRNYTIDGNVTLTNSDDTTRNIINLLDAANDPSYTDSGVFTAGSSVNVPLPASTQLDEFSEVVVEWNTGQTDGSASDNDHRRYIEEIPTVAIYDASGPNVIGGVGGRGAESYGVRITAAANDATSLSMVVVNINDAGGATLPAGTQISKVWFR